jgi:hypothetical protein
MPREHLNVVQIRKALQQLFAEPERAEIEHALESRATDLGKLAKKLREAHVGHQEITSRLVMYESEDHIWRPSLSQAFQRHINPSMDLFRQDKGEPPESSPVPNVVDLYSLYLDAAIDLRTRLIAGLGDALEYEIVDDDGGRVFLQVNPAVLADRLEGKPADVSPTTIVRLCCDPTTSRAFAEALEAAPPSVLETIINEIVGARGQRNRVALLNARVEELAEHAAVAQTEAAPEPEPVTESTEATP